MFISTRNVFRQLFLSTLFITAVFTILVWLTQSLRFVDVVVNKGLSLAVILKLMFFLLPDVIAIILPFGLFVAVAFVYTKMEQDHELMIYRSIGLSPFTLAKPAFYLSGAVMTFLFVINIYVMPASFRQFKDLEYSLREMMSLSLLKAQSFNTIGDYTVYVNAVGSDGAIENLMIHDNTTPKKPVIYLAKQGRLNRTSEGLQMHLLDGNRQHADAKTGKPELLFFDQYSVTLNQEKKRKGPRVRKPYELFLGELFTPENSLGVGEIKKHTIEGHKRILSPLLALVYVLIGLVLLLMKDYMRRHRYTRLIIASVSCFLVQIIVLGFFNLAGTAGYLIYANYTFVFSLILGCLWLLLRGDLPTLREKAS